MSAIQGKTDVENTFLSRREITCDFNGLGGSLTKIEALKMVTKEYGLDGKTVVPMILENHVGRTQVTGTFYVYDDEKLAKSHVIPNIFARLEKANAKIAAKTEEEAKKKASAEEAAKEEAAPAKDDDKPKEADAPKTGDKTDAPAKDDKKPKEDAPKTGEKPKEEKTDAPAKDDKKSNDGKSDKEVSS